MDPSNRNFMNLLNEASTNQFSNGPSQNSPSQQFPINLSQSQYSQFVTPSVLHNFYPFGPPPGNYEGAHPFGQSPPSFQGNFINSANHVFGAAPNRSQPLQQHWISPVAVGNSFSHGSESSLPRAVTEQRKQPIISIQESSGSSEEESGRRAPRVNWNEEENLRLVRSWLNHSVDAIKGIDQKGDYYWRAVADEFNSTRPKNKHIRTVKQLKTHWGGIKKDVSKFCGVVSRVTSAYVSGQSDDMIMDKAGAWFKSENEDRPFTLEYCWKELKDEPKWRRLVQKNEENNSKRTKISVSGAYTSSSNQETETESSQKEKRPEGQKKAKARQRGKGKSAATSPLGDQPPESLVIFNEAVKTRAAALIKSAEAMEKSAEGRKEETRFKKWEAYLKLEEKDIAGYSEARLKRHEAMLDQLARELADLDKATD